MIPMISIVQDPLTVDSLSVAQHIPGDPPANRLSDTPSFRINDVELSRLSMAILVHAHHAITQAAIDKQVELGALNPGSITSDNVIKLVSDLQSTPFVEEYTASHQVQVNISQLTSIRSRDIGIPQHRATLELKALQEAGMLSIPSYITSDILAIMHWPKEGATRRAISDANHMQPPGCTLAQSTIHLVGGTAVHTVLTQQQVERTMAAAMQEMAREMANQQRILQAFQAPPDLHV